MLFSQRRSMKSRQPGTVEILVNVDGTVATPVASGQDAMFVESIQDLGAGAYKINFKAKALQNLCPKGLVTFTAGVYGEITAVDTQSVTVAFKTGAGVATDAAFAICLNFASEVPYYF